MHNTWWCVTLILTIALGQLFEAMSSSFRCLSWFTAFVCVVASSLNVLSFEVGFNMFWPRVENLFSKFILYVSNLTKFVNTYIYAQYKAAWCLPIHFIMLIFFFFFVTIYKTIMFILILYIVWLIKWTRKTALKRSQLKLSWFSMFEIRIVIIWFILKILGLNEKARIYCTFVEYYDFEVLCADLIN